MVQTDIVGMCPKCRGDVVLGGDRITYYKCKGCGKTFNSKTAFTSLSTEAEIAINQIVDSHTDIIFAIAHHAMLRDGGNTITVDMVGEGICWTEKITGRKIK